MKRKDITELKYDNKNILMHDIYVYLFNKLKLIITNKMNDTDNDLNKNIILNEEVKGKFIIKFRSSKRNYK